MTTATTPMPKNHICPHKFAFMLDNIFRRCLQHPRKVVGEYLRLGDTVIDLGCGPGFFTIDMAKMVGPTGKVIAVDLQRPMLDTVARKARRHKVAEWVACHPCEAGRIGLAAHADFILAFYMIHETPDPHTCLMQIKELMKADARLLVVEPKMHVSQQKFEAMARQAEGAGLVVLDHPPKKGGRSLLLGLK
jgi:ubiquinone/menaquinone biosynthesis C-methylase UbiE